jgi:hypothetical protein
MLVQQRLKKTIWFAHLVGAQHENVEKKLIFDGHLSAPVLIINRLIEHPLHNDLISRHFSNSRDHEHF